MDVLVTYEEAAQILGIKVPSVKQLVKRGILQPIKRGDLRRTYLLRTQVEHRKEHPRVRHNSWGSRQADKIMWEYDRALQRLVGVL